MNSLPQHDTDAQSEGSDAFEQWECARELVDSLGMPPRFVTAAIHFLRLDTEKNSEELSHLSKNCLKPLLRSDTFKAAAYYCAKTFFPERLEGKSLDSPRKLAALFKPKEFIALISIVYLYKRMKKDCDAEMFENFVKSVGPNWILAGGVGRAIEKIGFANALIYHALPCLAQCLFLNNSNRKFKTYRVHLRQNKALFDTKYEEEAWGCNSLQLTVLLAQGLGLGKSYHDPIILGVGAPDLKSTEQDAELYAARLLQVWIDSLMSENTAPDMPHRGEFYPYSSELSRLVEFSSLPILEDAGNYFFQRGKEDLSEENTPELFAQSKKAETEFSTVEEEPLPSGLEEEILDSLAEDNILDG